MKTLFTLLIMFVAMACFAGTNPVLQNPATTNNTAALIVFIQQYASAGVGATNITAGGVLTGNSGTTATIPAGFSTAGSNYMIAVANSQIASQPLPGANVTGTVPAATTAGSATTATTATTASSFTGQGTLSKTNASDYLTYITGLFYGIGNSSGFQTAAQVSAAITAAGLYSASNPSGYQTAAQVAATSLAAAQGVVSTNYPAAAVFSFTTNFSLTAWPTNITIYLPAASANYLIQEELYIVAKSGNPHGAILPIGTALPSKYVSSGNSASYFAPPLSESPNGNNYVFTYDGDYVAFNDQTAVYNTFSAANFASSFSITARYTWTIHK